MKENCVFSRPTVSVSRSTTTVLLLILVAASLFRKDPIHSNPLACAVRVHGFATTTTSFAPRTRKLQQQQQQQQQKSLSVSPRQKTTTRIGSNGPLQLQSQLRFRSRDGDNGIPNPAFRKTSQTTTTIASTTVAFLLLWGGWSLPAIAIVTADNNHNSIEVNNNNNNNNMDVSSSSDLVKSLRPATERRPQIPFPTQQALQEAALDAATNTKTNTNTKNPFQRDDNNNNNPLLRENSYSLQALISLESRSRPYNGADVLVLTVSTTPSATATATESSRSNDGGSVIGGAKIPIAAVVGGFPVKVSLGPQNAMESSNSNSNNGKTAGIAAAEERWKGYLSSESLWLRGAVCRANGDGTTAMAVLPTPTRTTTTVCPPAYPLPILEGAGFSKFIDLSSITTPTTPSAGTALSSTSSTTATAPPQQSDNESQSQTRSSNGVVGLRAPVSLVLTAPAVAR